MHYGYLDSPAGFAVSHFDQDYSKDIQVKVQKSHDFTELDEWILAISVWDENALKKIQIITSKGTVINFGSTTVTGRPSWSFTAAYDDWILGIDLSTR